MGFYDTQLRPITHEVLKISIRKIKFKITSIFLRDKSVNSSPPGQNSRHFTDDIFRCIFVNEKFCILIKISLKFVPKGPIDNNPSLV